MRSQVFGFLRLLWFTVILFPLILGSSATANETKTQSRKDFVASMFNKIRPIEDELLKIFTTTQLVNDLGEIETVQMKTAYMPQYYATLPNDIHKCNRTTKLLKDFNKEELMMVFGSKSVVNGKDNYLPSLLLIKDQYFEYWRKNKKPPRKIEDLYSIKSNWYKEIKPDIERNSNYVNQYFSAITYEPLDFNNPKFTPGQIYITPVSAPESNRGKNQKPFGPEYLEDGYLAFYLRIYGTDKILYETIVSMDTKADLDAVLELIEQNRENN